MPTTATRAGPNLQIDFEFTMTQLPGSKCAGSGSSEETLANPTVQVTHEAELGCVRKASIHDRSFTTVLRGYGNSSGTANMFGL